MAIIINLFGVPGAGKSTGAAYVFYKLKADGVNAELITEFAKDKVWEDNSTAFENQAYIFGNQSFKISRCADKVDVVVTDSPLPLSIFYNADPKLTENFSKTVMDTFNFYDNINFLLNRVKEYNPIGRHQNEEQSDALKRPLIDLLQSRDIEYIEIDGCVDGYNKIYEIVKQKLSKEQHNGN